MPERLLMRLELYAAAGVLAATAIAVGWSAPLATGILAGGSWNLASLWCLAHLLNAWLGPQRSRRLALGWLILKFPLLYVLAFGFVRASIGSLVGFGVGFTLVLIVVVGGLAIRARPLSATRSYGR